MSELGEGIGPPPGTRERSRRGRKRYDEEYDYNTERARREYYDAEAARIKLDEAEGRLISAELVRAEATRTYRQFRDAMQALPDRLAGQLTGQTDQNQIHSILTLEIRKALNEFSDTINLSPDDPAATSAAGPASGDADDAAQTAA